MEKNNINNNNNYIKSIINIDLLKSGKQFNKLNLYTNLINLDNNNNYNNKIYNRNLKLDNFYNKTLKSFQ